MSNDTAEKTVADVISKVGLWWPAADEDELREAASLWRTFAGEVDGVAADGSSAARDLVGTNTGPGVDAFDAFWARYDGGSQAYLPAIASSARDMATALDDFATAVVGAKDKVRELAVEIGATLVVGTVLAFFTFGAAEAAAAGISAGLISAAAAIGVELGATAATIAGAVVAGAAFGAVESAAVDVAVAQPIRVEVFHDGGFSLGEVEQSFAVGGALGGLLGGAGSAVRVLRGVRPAKGPGLVKVNKPDPAADDLAERLGGESRVRFDDDPSAREFDAVSDEYVAQSKPGGYQFNKAGRDQAKATFEAAQRTGRSVYYHFDGPPSPSVIAKLQEYSERYHVTVTIDTTKYGS